MQIVVDRVAQVDTMAPSRQQTEAYKMTYGDGIAFAILGITVLIWVNLQMMGVI